MLKFLTLRENFDYNEKFYFFLKIHLYSIIFNRKKMSFEFWKLFLELKIPKKFEMVHLYLKIKITM